MFIRQFVIAALLMVCSLPIFAAAQYQLSSGDVININVFGESDLSFKEIRLTDAGTFSYPFIGEINAKGLTPTEVEKLITDKLKDGYLVAPRVSVSVLTYRQFYISGEVKLPGGYPFQPGLTLDRAIAVAGGLTERASDKRISIVRGTDPTRRSLKASLNTLVEPGDTITIEQGFF
ncbi:MULTISPECIES: polysaccharide biosynthesis/export family protein [unclassified Pseudomonas]|uniref:polysaccharide biosynthesis/export family protein n=1 Tax=unclassified Pseudomonas TaxID=196821 RepID=UPI002AC8B32D|nr:MULTISPECIES: polysaccharide biosynthesis/export family protein [unclassified Pseudomonas]MEB0039874.1 polysaccharide biosynthesis/export family protein [Pseudomonas sp. MH10]MEB0077184.1 polysaccharide biosynthesis/export family protein [Pseudomonas sp. MH10out]MEB0091485.1 polysaccharide biosynthesis/export family protein [Pseudomonas sp. CCI4.2]MEB0101531.1 polysaccharide biosynthesis/export family protein [Pseudomonas sp. CCI3.2]MEB0120642.1 polysaccharide biosynthesis/export family pro